MKLAGALFSATARLVYAVHEHNNNDVIVPSCVLNMLT